MHILFICTGNICRSPTAERLAAAYAARHGVFDVTTSSAGTRAVIGHPIHQDAARVLDPMGADTANFAARQFTLKIATKADLVIAMTREHRDVVLETAPRQLRRTFTLIEAARLTTEFGALTISDLAALRPRLAANEPLDIPDPIGQSPEVFAAVGSQIAGLLPPIIELCRRTITA